MASVDYSMPLLPQGLALDPMHSRVMNIIRDGPIPICLSAYRFYRGGLRFKLLSNIEGMNFAVQIRSDRCMRTDSPQAGARTVADSVYQYGYPLAIQCTTVNPMMTIEAPFYCKDQLGMLQRPSLESMQNNETSRFYSLGQLCLSSSHIFTSERKNLNPNITVLYCLADDFSPYIFQGFPPMCMIADSKTDS